MRRQKEHQLQIIWEHIPSHISIPAEMEEELVNLLGNLLSVYWQGHKTNNYHRQKGDEHDRENHN